MPIGVRALLLIAIATVATISPASAQTTGAIGGTVTTNGPAPIEVIVYTATAQLSAAAQMGSASVDLLLAAGARVQRDVPLALRPDVLRGRA